MMECTLILMPFTKETASLHAKPEKHKLHLSASSLRSETRHFDALTHNYTSAHIQVFEIHQKYVISIYAFGSAHVKIGV